MEMTARTQRKCNCDLLLCGINVILDTTQYDLLNCFEIQYNIIYLMHLFLYKRFYVTQ